MRSPIWTSPRPHSFATPPAETDGRCTDGPCSKTAIAVTLPSSSEPKLTRSRVRIVPESIRT
jgi:hypothetical protein